MPNARLSWILPHFSVNLSLYPSMKTRFISPPQAYASYLRYRIPPTSLPYRSPTLTLPLEEDADGETHQGADNKELRSIDDTTSHEHRGNAASQARTRSVQSGKSKAGQALKPVSSRISKQSPKQRALRRRTPKQQHEAKHVGGRTGNSQKTRQVEPQDSNSTSSATFSTHHANEPGNLNDRPNSFDKEVQSHGASTDLYRERAQRATRSRTRALENKLSTKRKARSPASSMVPKRNRRNPAQGARRSKQEEKRKSPRENKTRSGRVSKRPERFGFT